MSSLAVNQKQKRVKEAIRRRAETGQNPYVVVVRRWAYIIGGASQVNIGSLKYYGLNLALYFITTYISKIEWVTKFFS